MIGIIDIGFGNINAVINAVKSANVPCARVSDPNDKSYTGWILPGVGKFDPYISCLKQSGFQDLLRISFVNRVPILGICVGMHALACSSEEGHESGLSFVKGKVQKIKSQFPTPHMGWNSISSSKCDLLEGIDFDKGFYFLHSYSFNAEKKGECISVSNYGSEIQAVVNTENCFGVQFHPEKSHKNGTILFGNFWRIVENAKA